MSSTLARAAALAQLIEHPRLRATRVPHDPLSLPSLPQFCPEQLCGRWIELSDDGAAGAATLATSLCLQIQRAGGWPVWISPNHQVPLAADLASWGLDLAALPLIAVANTTQAIKSSVHLLQSGAFSLLVLDLGEAWQIPLSIHGKLAKLAQHHACAFVCLTKKTRDTPSIGSMVSLRGHTRIRKIQWDRFVCELFVEKDKHNGPGWSHEEFCYGPCGLH